MYAEEEGEEERVDRADMIGEAASEDLGGEIQQLGTRERGV
jgi:hypothetical protein